MSASDERGGVVFEDTGPTAPTLPETRNKLAPFLRNAWGQNIDLVNQTPQRQILDTWSACVFDKNNKLIFLTEQWNPQTAEGRYQENICKIYFISRKDAIRTSVECVCTGLVGTVIEQGSLVMDSLNREFFADAEMVIPEGGSVTGIFKSVIEGPVAVAANTITRIAASVNGWDTVNNPEAGVTGAYRESRLALEHRRYASVAKNAHGNQSAVESALADLDDVISVAVEENVGDDPKIIKGVLVPGHSFYISIVGGDEQEIAQAIYERKDGGCGYSGNTPIVRYLSTQDADTRMRKTFVIDRPPALRTRMRIVVDADPDRTPGDIADAIRARVLEAWNGAAFRPRVKQGDTVYALSFSCPINDIGNSFSLVSIEVSRRTPTPSTIPEEDFFYTGPDGHRYIKTTQMLTNQYPDVFSYADNDGGLVINNRNAVTVETWTEWADSFDTRLDEYPVLDAADISVIVEGADEDE